MLVKKCLFYETRIVIKILDRQFCKIIKIYDDRMHEEVQNVLKNRKKFCGYFYLGFGKEKLKKVTCVERAP